MAAPEKLQEKAELKVVNGSENTSAVLKLIDGGLEKAKDKTTTKKVDQTKPVAVATSNDEEEEKRKREQRGNVLNPFAALIKNFFKVDALPTDAKTENWAGQFAARARNNFEGYKTEEKFVQEIVEANKYDPELAAQAVTDVYRVAKAKGFDVTKIEERVKEIEAKLLSDEPIAGIEVVDTPINVSSLYEEEEPVNVVSIDELGAQKAESETLNPEQRTQKEMEASIASTLGLLDEANPARAKAEEVLRQLKNGELHKFDKEALQKLIVEWIPLQATQIPEPERELIQAVVTTGYRVAEDVGINTEEVKTNVTREVLSRIQQQSPAEDAVSLEPKLRIVRPDEQEPEAAETPSNIRAFPEDRIVRQHTEPILADGESEVVKAKKAATLDEGLRNRRSEQDWKDKLDPVLKTAVGTPEEDKTRLERAAFHLGIQQEDMKPPLKAAIIKAHEVGKQIPGEEKILGADGINEPKLGNYTLGQIREKIRIIKGPVAEALGVADIVGKSPSEKLSQAEIDAAETLVTEKIDVLMNKGILGSPVLDEEEMDLDELPPDMAEEYKKFKKKNPDEVRMSIHEFAQREIMKSPILGEGEDREQYRARLVNELRNRLSRVTNEEELERFIDSTLKRLYTEKFAVKSAAQESTETVTEDGKRGRQTNEKKFKKIIDIHNANYAGYRKAVFDAPDLNAKLHQADEMINTVMGEVNKIDNIYTASGERLKNPKNLVEFARLLMIADPRKYGSKQYLDANPEFYIDDDGNRIRIEIGTSPMFDEGGALLEENVMNWIKDRMEYLHNESPDDQISFFQAIDLDLPGMYRPIQIGSLLRNEGFFVNEKNEPLLNFHKEVTNTVWLIGYMRNADVLIRKGFLEEDKVIGVLQQLFQTNTLSKGALGSKSVLEWFFTMPQHFKENIDPKNLDTKVGDAVGEAYLIYYNIANYKYLKKEFGDLEYFMTRKGVERAIGAVISGSNDPRAIEAALNDHDKFNRFMRNSELSKGGHDIFELFGPDGKFIETPANQRALVDYLNPFYPFNKNQKQLSVVRKLVEQAAAERAGLFLKGDAAKVVDKDGKRTKENNIRMKWGVLDQGSSFAELTAYFMGYPLGAGTRNQTGVQAINVLEKATMPYLYMQKLETIERAGATGNRFTHGLLKGSFVDYMTGVQAVSGETITQILENQHLVRKIEYEARKAGVTDFEQYIERALAEAIPNNEERGEVIRRIRADRARKVFEIIAKLKDLPDDKKKELLQKRDSILGNDKGIFNADNLLEVILEGLTQEQRNDLDKKFSQENITDPKEKVNAALNTVDKDIRDGFLRQMIKRLEDKTYGDSNTKIEEIINLLPAEIQSDVKAELTTFNNSNAFRVIRQEVAERLQFKRNDSLTHTSQWENAWKLYKHFINGDEVDYAKFSQTTYFGYEFDQAGLQAALKKEWITPARYTFLTNKMPMNVMVENLKDNKKDNKYEDYVWDRAPLVETFFNEQVLLTAQKIWAHEMKNPYTDNMKKVANTKVKVNNVEIALKDVEFVDPKSGKIKRDPENKNKLSPEVNAILADGEFNRVVLKAFLLCKFGGDLYSHTKLRTGAKHLKFGQREQAIAALANITAGIKDNPFDFTENEVTHYFFTKYDIQLLRKMSKNSFWKGLTKEFAIEGGMGAVEGLFKGLGKVFSEIFK